MTMIYEILRRPLVTEKSNYQSGMNQYSYIVADSATRTQVKDAIETIYDVNVARVNIINVPAKLASYVHSGRIFPLAGKEIRLQSR